jgi:hypothetical protein
MLWYVVLIKNKNTYTLQISEMRKSSIAFFFNSDLIILATSWAEAAYHLELL